jgi:hypothetical protein
LNPEESAQKYGGDISDYYTNKQKQQPPGQDDKNLQDIYKQQVKPKNNKSILLNKDITRFKPE